MAQIGALTVYSRQSMLRYLGSDLPLPTIEISDTRTPEHAANAMFWDFPAGTYTLPGYWNEEAARLAVKYRLSGA